MISMMNSVGKSVVSCVAGGRAPVCETAACSCGGFCLCSMATGFKWSISASGHRKKEKNNWMFFSRLKLHIG